MATSFPGTPLQHAGARGSPRQAVSTPWLASHEARSPSRLAAGARTMPRSGMDGRLQRVATERVAREPPASAAAAAAKAAPMQSGAVHGPVPRRSRSLSLEPQPHQRQSTGLGGARPHDEPPSRQPSPPPQSAQRQPQDKQRTAEDRRRPYYAKAKDVRTHLEREAELLRRREELRRRKEAEKLAQQEEELRECTFRPQLIASSPKVRSRAQSPSTCSFGERASAASADAHALQTKLAQLAERQASATNALQALAADEARLWKRLCAMHAEVYERMRREAEAELYSSGLSTIEEVGLPIEEIQRRAAEAFQPAQMQAEGELYARRLALVQELEAIEAQAMMVLHTGALVDKAKELGLEFGLAEHARRSMPPAGASQGVLTAPSSSKRHSNAGGRASPSSRRSLAESSRRRASDGIAGAHTAPASPVSGARAARMGGVPPLASGPGGLAAQGQARAPHSANTSPGASRAPSATATAAAPRAAAGAAEGPGTPRSKQMRGLAEEVQEFAPVRRRLEFPGSH
eukprot:CAMPEP_0171172390 /NCGR_PEP_ID=MMETSP0790-20130122/9696_1 /TAXON_ID=2925 /ORGANISM="Alexandrium catenella, Strain OF101" /LENGTH=518 /DNA_ID=CAMNT_0011637249 /DNA_START=48 /DNA_END=1607 /DNA_ORIENTATION=-